jgi:hypothetical protein
VAAFRSVVLNMYPKDDRCTSPATHSPPARLTPVGLPRNLIPYLKMMADTSLQGDDPSLEGNDPMLRTVRQSAQVVSSRLGDAGVLVHLQTNRIFEVNATGLRIWELAGTGRTIAGIEATLRDEFDVEPARLRTELLDLVNELSREGLLERC